MIKKKRTVDDYVKGKITFTEAARRAGLTLLDMEHYLVDNGFTSTYSIDDLEKEMELLAHLTSHQIY